MNLSINQHFKNFTKNLHKIGFTSSTNDTNDNNFNLSLYDNKLYLDLFDTLNKFLENDKFVLSNPEKLLLNEYDHTINNNDNFDFDEHILHLKEQLLLNEITLLEDEMNTLDHHINKEEIQLELEDNQFKLNQNDFVKFESNLKINIEINERNLNNFEMNLNNNLISKLNLLYNNTMKIISEFDLNLKCVENENKILIDFKKFNNFEFFKIIEIFEEVLNLFYQQYSEIKNGSIDNNINKENLNDTIEIEDFKILLSKFDELEKV